MRQQGEVGTVLNWQTHALPEGQLLPISDLCCHEEIKPRVPTVADFQEKLQI